jgi:hypothetical protein
LRRPPWKSGFNAGDPGIPVKDWGLLFWDLAFRFWDFVFGIWYLSLISYHIHSTVSLVPGVNRMKCLIVYYVNGHWIGEEVSWKRSGSGTYREVSRIEIPQSKAEIEAFAAANRFVIEWRGDIPAEPATAAART